ncbi:hypothetical protein BS50DRAFT_311206 [Corynespora cassiicola Philippines]|uniref:Uncharacterized protein n=1 Tax=Corynespora cassiicola Philippines TaxID=1448308 RepID=A0A2T2NY64_CORCC|nr:hypothetical protein BS50DRAFT_311206 [Corynespora cassiicola Philippines]
MANRKTWARVGSKLWASTVGCCAHVRARIWGPSGRQAGGVPYLAIRRLTQAHARWQYHDGEHDTSKPTHTHSGRGPIQSLSPPEDTPSTQGVQLHRP